MIRKSIFAALLISLGMYVLAATPFPFGQILFAFGLMSICYCNGYLYTGKCGYVFEDKQYKQLACILIFNLIAGWIFGYIISYAYPDAYSFAQLKIRSWINPLAHILQAMGCGAVMFLAVDIKKKHNTALGILYGVPLFLCCGLQHSIANIIACGMAQTLSPIYLFYILLAVIGNFIGASGTWYLLKQ